MELPAHGFALSLVRKAGQTLADYIDPHHVHIVSTKNGNRLEILVDGRYMVSMESEHPVETADALRAWTHKLLTASR